MKIEDTYEKPFPDIELTEEDFVPIESLVGREIEICDTKTYENDKGPGIYILFRFATDKKEPAPYKYTATHSINLTSILTKDMVQEALETGDVLECKIVKRPSKRDGSKTVYTLI